MHTNYLNFDRGTIVLCVKHDDEWIAVGDIKEVKEKMYDEIFTLSDLVAFNLVVSTKDYSGIKMLIETHTEENQYLILIDSLAKYYRFDGKIEKLDLKNDEQESCHLIIQPTDIEAWVDRPKGVIKCD